MHDSWLELVQVRVPDAPTLPNLLDWVIMLAVALTSFGGQLVVGRAYQIEQASKVAAVSYVQVRLPGCCLSEHGQKRLAGLYRWASRAGI